MAMVAQIQILDMCLPRLVGLHNIRSWYLPALDVCGASLVALLASMPHIPMRSNIHDGVLHLTGKEPSSRRMPVSDVTPFDNSTAMSLTLS